MRWSYEKDASNSANYDGGWLDEVFFVSDAPRITVQPVGRTVEAGETVTFTAAASGKAPLSYAWRKGGIPVPGATQGTLVVRNVQTADAGTYTFVASNALGSDTSTGAVLTVMSPISLGDALDAPALAWSTGGSNVWYGSRRDAHDGVDTACPAKLNHMESVWLRTTVQGPGTATFWWRVSSEEDYDFARFLVGTNLRVRASGDVGWCQETIPVLAGIQELTWIYEKDASVAEGADGVWVDRFAFTPTRPEIDAVDIDPGWIRIHVPSQAGRIYRLSYRDALHGGSWISLPGVPGNGTMIVLTNIVGDVPQRYYRVTLE